MVRRIREAFVAASDYEVLDDRFTRCIVMAARVEKLFEGCRWAEGPAWFPAHRSVVWSDIPNDRMMRFDEASGNVSVFRKVIFPYALPGIIDTARVNLAAAWNLIVVTEVIASNEGLGRRIVSAQKFLKTDEIFAVLIVIGVIGLTTDVALRTLRNRLSPWSQEKA